MKLNVLHKFRETLGNLKLSGKIRLLLLLVIIPMFCLSVAQFISMNSYNQQYDRIIANASKAGQFSINFKEEFDQKVYLLIVGNSTFAKEDPYGDIDSARVIVTDLINNTNIEDNKHRARSIMNMLGNLQKYIKHIETNKQRIREELGAVNLYDENISIWENDVQVVTGLIQTAVLEYTYYETKDMEKLRMAMSESLGTNTLVTLIIFALLVAAAFILSFIIPKSIAKPISYLCKVTDRVADGDLAVRVEGVRGAEVSKLGASLNSMIEKTQLLLHAVEVDQKNLREAELELLQAQINPHFLYNTLDTIIWLTESGKQQEVVDIVGSLSDFFRTSLSHGNGTVSLRDEERHVCSYMKIQQVRYQDILDYEINIPEEAKQALIPKISLQPLVENAIYHGVKNRRGKGLIRVCAATAGDDVLICVEDNGIGMTQNQLMNIRARLEWTGKQQGEQKQSYGLYNVNERIKLKFGENYGITIDSAYGEGTCVEVRIPLAAN